MTLDENFDVKYVNYGPFPLRDEDIDHLGVFQISVNTAVTSLRVEHAKVLRVSSSVSAFVDNEGHHRGFYFAQIDYVPGDRDSAK